MNEEEVIEFCAKNKESITFIKLVIKMCEENNINNIKEYISKAIL